MWQEDPADLGETIFLLDCCIIDCQEEVPEAA
jgi:hypothetical protein